MVPLKLPHPAAPAKHRRQAQNQIPALHRHLKLNPHLHGRNQPQKLAQIVQPPQLQKHPRQFLHGRNKWQHHQRLKK